MCFLMFYGMPWKSIVVVLIKFEFIIFFCYPKIELYTSEPVNPIMHLASRLIEGLNEKLFLGLASLNSILSYGFL